MGRGTTASLAGNTQQHHIYKRECGKLGSPMTCVSIGGHKTCALGLKSCIKIQLTSHEKCINCFVSISRDLLLFLIFQPRRKDTMVSGAQRKGVCSRHEAAYEPATENTILWNFFRSKTGSRKDECANENRNRRAISVCR